MASYKATAYGSSRTANAFTVTNSGAVFNPASSTSYAQFKVANSGTAGTVYVYGFPKDIFYYFGKNGPERYDGSSYELHIAALNWSEIYIRDIYGNTILTIPSASSTMPTGVTLSQRSSNIYDITVSGSVLGSDSYDIESVDLKSLTSGTLYICGIDIEITYTNWNVETDYYVYGTGSIEYKSGSSTTSTVTEAMMNQQGRAFKGYPVSDTEEQTLLIHPSSDNDQVIVTLNNVDVSSKLITIPAGGYADLGTYTLVSGGFGGSGATYFSGLVGKGEAADTTSSNYYSSASGTQAVFTYDVGISLPAGTTITNVYLRVSGHAESTSNADEYMCVQLKSGDTYFSDQLNFKSIGTSNTVQTVTATTIPTIAQLAEMKVECTLGYYGGAINGATLYVEIAGSGPATKKLIFTSHDKICWNYDYMEWGCVQVFIGSSAISNVYDVTITNIGPYPKAKFICFPPLGSYLYSDNYPGVGFGGLCQIRTAALTLMKLTTQSNEGGYMVIGSTPAGWYSVHFNLMTSIDGDSTVEYAIANKHTAYAKTGSSTWETGSWFNYTGSEWVNTTTPRNFFSFLKPGQSFKSRSLGPQTTLITATNYSPSSFDSTKIFNNNAEDESVYLTLNGTTLYLDFDLTTFFQTHNVTSFNARVIVTQESNYPQVSASANGMNIMQSNPPTQTQPTGITVDDLGDGDYRINFALSQFTSFSGDDRYFTLAIQNADGFCGADFQITYTDI